MLRLRMASNLVVVLLVTVLVAGDWCLAQERDGRGDRGGRFRGPGPRMRIGGPGGMGKAMLLRSDQVQKELDLSEDQVKQIREVMESARNDMRELFAGVRELPEDKRREKFRELREEARQAGQAAEEKVGGILKEKQEKRLNEIVLQLQGLQALAGPEVAGKVGLSDKQRQEIRDTFAAQRDMQREMFSGLRDLPRDERRKKFEELQKKRQKLNDETEKAVMGVLTDEQKKKWQQLQGEEFELDRRSLFRRGGRGGRRGGGDRDDGDGERSSRGRDQ